MIAIDGKTLRHFYDKEEGEKAIHIVSAWATTQRLVLMLDVAFREDDCRIRKDYAPQNFAILRHVSLNLLNQEKTSKTGVKNKRLRAEWDDEYLAKILALSAS